MNKNRTLGFALVALVLSLGLFYTACRGLQDPSETTQVAAARKVLDRGTRIAKEDVQVIQWPKSAPLEGSFSDPAQVVGRTLKTSVQVNEPIVESKLVPK